MRRALVVAFALYVVLGLPDGALGPIWPDLRDDFGRTDSSFGLVILASALGYTTTSIGAGHFTDRFGVGPVLRVSTAIATAGLLTIAAGPDWWPVLAGFLLLGAGWGLVDAAVNAWVAITQGPREMGLLHACYGVGAFLGPLLATVFVADGGSWRGPFGVVVALLALTVAALLRSGRAFDDTPTSAEVAEHVTGRAAGPVRLMAELIAWFAVYVGVEVAIGQWSFTLLTEGRGHGDVEAGVLVAGFWGGLMVGRFLLAGVGHVVEPERVLSGSIMLAVLATVVLWVDPSGLGGYSLPLIGFALSVMFPLAMGRTAVYLGEDRARRAVGYQMAASAVGFTALPALIGVLADRHGVGVAPGVAFAGMVVMAALWAVIQRDRAPSPVSRSAP